MNDSFKTALAFIGGAAAGAAIGILLAPDKGSETRKKILSKAKDLGDGLTDAAMEKYDEFLSWKDDMMNNTEQKAKTVVNENLNKAEGKVKTSTV
jgi:gas vesicle protein